MVENMKSVLLSFSISSHFDADLSPKAVQEYFLFVTVLFGKGIIQFIYRSVTRAVQNLVEPDLLQSQAVDVRMELDLRIGKLGYLSQLLAIHPNLP